MTASPKAFAFLTLFAWSHSFSQAVPKVLAPVLNQRCAPCHGPDLNGVGGVFPSLMTSELVKSGNMDGVIKFITYGSPADSKSLVKMPAKGGHLDLGEEEIRDIAKQVINLAHNYVEKKPSKVVSLGGYFKDRFGPVVSTAIETAPVVAWPPAGDASDRLKRLYLREKKLLAKVREMGGNEFTNIGLEDLSNLKTMDLSRPSDPIKGTSGNSPQKERPLLAIDDQPATKYLNFDGAGSGLEIKIQNAIVNGITITSANDAPERDPKSFVLSGSNDGKSFVEIASGSIPVSRGRGKLKTMRFPNGKSFSTYRVVFPELAGDGKIPVQIAEFELLPKLEGSPIDDLSKEATKLLGQMDEVRQKVRYIISRAHLVPLGEDRRAGMVFDSETMSYSMAWTNDQSLKASGMPFAGAHGAAAVVKESYNLFRTGMRPGWAKAKEMIQEDPRRQPYKSFPRMGALPKDWVHFKGHYVHNGKAIFSYSVGEGRVLDMPGIVKQKGLKALTRTVRVANPSASVMLLAENDDSQIEKTDQTFTVSLEGRTCNFSLVDFSKGVKLFVWENLLLCEVPKGNSRFKVAMWAGDPAYQPAIRSAAGKAEDLSKLTQGGSAQWGGPISVESELSDNQTDAYVVDKIGVPFNNPHEPKMRIGAFDFFKDGKTAAVCTWDGDVWIVSHIDEKLDKVTWKRFATGLHEPLGLKIVNEKIHTVGDNQITRFHDYNGDDEADFLENFNNDWENTEGFHAFCFDLHTDPEGNFYFAIGCPVRAGGRGFERMGKHHGSVIKVSPDGKKLSIYASGFRAPNGIGVGPNGEVTTGDNEGSFVPSAPLHWVKPGSFNGVVDSYHGKRKLKSSPILGYEIEYKDWKKYKADAREGFQHDPSEAPKPLVWMSKKRGIDNSGGGQAWVTSDKWGPLKDQLLHLSYGQSKMYVVLKEEKKGLMQGGVARMPVELSSSAMRARINPRDGQLYTSGLKGWQTNAKGNGGLDRIRYTGKPVHLPKSIKVNKDVVEIGFYEPLDPEAANSLSQYKFGAWNLKWSFNYGSLEIPVKELELKKVELLDDGKTVALHIPNLKPVHMAQIDYDIKSAKGEEIKGRIDHTIHVVE
jgi:mono/diheme cytochrome c family protein